MKVPTDSRQKHKRSFVFSGESPAKPVQSTATVETLDQSIPSTQHNGSNVCIRPEPSVIQANQCHKRRREEDISSESESEGEFYGFPADSNIFDEFPDNVVISELPTETTRRSKRKLKKKRKNDYVYY